MAVDGRSDHIELQDNIIYETIENTTKPTAQEKDLWEKVQSDIRLYGRVGVGVGLLCLALSVAVPLYLNQSKMVEREQLVNSYKELLGNLTKERDQLLDRINKVTVERDQLLDSNNNLTRERDQSLDRCNNLYKKDDVKRKLCGSGFTYDGGVCYYISTVKKNWWQSRQWCRERQSNLIVIKSKEKQDLVERVNKTVWLGLIDRGVKGSFEWIDEIPLATPTYWLPGQPNHLKNKPPDRNATHRHCVEFLVKGVDLDTRGWNDIGCLTDNLWICERAL